MITNLAKTPSIAPESQDVSQALANPAIQTIEKRQPLDLFEVTIPATQGPVAVRNNPLQALPVLPLRCPPDRVTQSLYAFLTWTTL